MSFALSVRMNLRIPFALWLALAVGCGDDDGVAATHGAGGATSSATSTTATGPASGGMSSGGAGTTVAFVDESGVVVDSLRFGEPFALTATQVPSGPVEVVARTLNYESRVVFTPDDGALDTRNDAPTSGDYQGVRPEGMLWSMRQASGGPGATLDIEVVVSADGSPIATATLHREPYETGLLDEPVMQEGLVGHLWKPALAVEPLGGIIVLGGSEGGLNDARARQLAGYGYAAFALAYFGEPGLPDQLYHVPVEYFGTALNYLAARPDVDAEHLSVLGGSRGGELALMLAARFPQLKAVVAEVPSGYRWGAAWMAGGNVLPFVPSSPAGPTVIDVGGTSAQEYRTSFLAHIDAATSEQLDLATIRVEDSEASILMIAGGADDVWPSCDLAQVAMDRLVVSGHSASHDDELLCFPNAGHQVAYPGWPTELFRLGPEFAGGYPLALGGTAAGIAELMRSSDRRIREFLAAHVQP